MQQLLSEESINLISEYVTAQTVKIEPVLTTLQRPKYIDQLAESYIADLILYMFEVMGTKRASEFKKKHLGFSHTQALEQQNRTMFNSSVNPLNQVD